MHIINTSMKIVGNGVGQRWKRAFFPIKTQDAELLGWDTESEIYMIILAKDELDPDKIAQKIRELCKLNEIDDEIQKMKANIGVHMYD